jgi:hypothetical protein
MKKLLISDKVIWDIKDMAAQDWRTEHDFSRFDTQELQIYLILRGLERVLKREGQDVPFEMPVKEVGDSLPIDESGLDNMS